MGTKKIEPGADLAAAIAAADEGATLKLAAGEFALAAPVITKKSLTLAGAGKTKTTITGSGNHLLLFEGDGELVLRRLALCRESGGDVVQCSSGRITVDTCTIEGARVDGDSGGVGLRLWESASGLAKKCFIRDNQFAGAAAMMGATLRVDQCALDNPQLGVWAIQQSSVSVSGCKLKGGLHAVTGAGQGRVTISDCQVKGMERSGIYLCESVQAEVTGCTVEKSGIHGLHAEGSARVVWTGNTCRNNAGGGLVLQGSASGQIRGNTARGSGQLGIYLDGETAATIADNEVFGSAFDGILVRGEARAEVTGNTCQGNVQHGVQFVDQASGSITGNRCKDNGAAGVMVPRNSGPVPRGRPPGGKPKKPATMKALLGRLEKKLQKERPELFALLRPGAGKEALDELEEQLGVKLPASYRALYRWREGQEDDFDHTFWEEFQLCPLEEVTEHVQILNELVEAGEFEFEDWWHGDWLPFLGNGASDVVCVDAGGAFGGYKGQVLHFWHDGEDRPIIHPTLEHFLDALVRGDEATLEGYPIATRACMPGEPVIVVEGNEV